MGEGRGWDEGGGGMREGVEGACFPWRQVKGHQHKTRLKHVFIIEECLLCTSCN